MSGTITLLEGACFCISSEQGDIVPGGREGLFLHDTRFLSDLRLLVDGDEPELLQSVQQDPFGATFVLRSHSTLVVERQRLVGQGMREELAVRNLATEATYCKIEVRIATDFADVEDVRNNQVRALDLVCVSEVEGGLELSIGKGRKRGVRVVSDASPAIGAEADALVFEVIVPARGGWSTWLEVVPIVDGEQLEPLHRPGGMAEHDSPAERLERWRRTVPVIESDDPSLDRVLAQSARDLGALRVFDPDVPERVVVAAGAPWSMSLHGRDAMLTAWMALLVDPDLAIGVLETLARFQGDDVDPRTEEEPGRILHQLRFGAGSTGPTFGSVDSTPLFVMLLGELRRWGLAPEPVERLLPHADRALEWIEAFGDRDGDGYVEYQRATDKARIHQGWKDSSDAIRHADGTPGRPPIALAEVQGYVYSAFVARAHFAAEAGDDAGEARWRGKADDLRTRFNRDFWLDSENFVALGLDHDNKPIDAVCSNAGHCLWTGILDEDKAAIVARRLLAPDLFSGWGVRTLSSSAASYNPISYQNGSVWPHDNAIVAAGLMRYGFVSEAQRIIVAMLDAANAFGGRLPELFAGFDRSELSFPVSYPSSCSPQAWAASAPLLFLRTLLRFEPWIPAGKLWLAPVLPPRITRLRIEGIPLLGGRINVEVDGDAAKVEGLAPTVEVVAAPRAPRR